jgi:hypothetical protein
VGFDVKYRNNELCIHKLLQKIWEYNETVCQLFMDFKGAYNSDRSKVLYNIFIVCGVHKRTVGLIKMCLNKTQSKALVRADVAEELSASFFRVTSICELGTALAVTSNRSTLRRNTK